MRTAIPILFLLLVLAFLFAPVQRAVTKWLRRRRVNLFLAASLLAGAFCLIAAYVNALSLPLAIAIFAYTLVPSALAYWGGAKLPDLLLMLLLWLPLELGLGGRWIPRPAQGFLHTVAYGVAITLALTIFLCYRELKGMKYNVPGKARDFVFPLAGFVLVAPVLIALGLLLGFIQPFHVPEQLSWTRVLTTYAIILAGVALPEEILFRGLIQNWLMQKLGASNRTLLVAAVIFGAAHFNNGPGPLPNWRYAILATIAGFAYGKVFQASSSVFASAFLHALVNTVRHTFF